MMTLIPAVVGGRLRGRRDRCDGASGSHAPPRHRGREPDRVKGTQLAGAQAHDRGPERVDRGSHQGRHHRPRDQAARRPAGRPPAPSLLDGGRHRRVRSRGRDRLGTSSRRSSAIDDGSTHGGGLPPGQRRLVRARPRATDLHDYGLTLPVDTDAYNSIGGLRLRRAGAMPGAATRSANGYSIRVESVRENRIEAVRIRDRRGPRRPPRSPSDDRAINRASSPARLR